MLHGTYNVKNKYFLRTSYTDVILISTYQVIFVTDNGSEYIFWPVLAIIIPFPDILVQIDCM